MKPSMYKKVSELSAWDLDATYRRYVNQSSDANRRLKKKLLRRDRKRLDKWLMACYN